jgi:hypothetical protein
LLEMKRYPLFAVLPFLLAPQTSFSGEPLYVPDYTAVSPEEVTVARKLQPGLLTRLGESGFIVLDGAVAGTVVNCALEASCPGESLRTLPSRLALVVSIASRNGTLSARVQVYDRGDPLPVDDYAVTIEAGHEGAFFDQVVRGLRDVLRLGHSAPAAMIEQAEALTVGSRQDDPIVVLLDEEGVMDEEGPINIVPAAPLDLDFSDEEQAITPAAAMAIDLGDSGPKRFELNEDELQVAPAPVPPAPAPDPLPVTPASAPTPLPVTPAPAPTPLRTLDRSEMTIDEILQDTGVELKHVNGAEKHLKASGLDPRDWVYKFTPHAGRVVVEVRGGVANGDVDRAADLRIALVDGEQVSSWYQESPAAASRLRGALYFGYAPFAAMDFGVVIGIQYGFRALTTGWSVNTDTGIEEAVSDVSIVQAAQGYVQPRARAYLVHLGPLKPYLVVGADFRVLDKYDLDQPDGLQYPSPPASSYPGLMAGGGLLLDPSPIVGVFVESSYSQYFGTRSALVQNGDWEGTVPAPRGYGQNAIAVVAGLQFRM